MAKPLAAHPRLGKLVVGQWPQRPSTAQPSALRHRGGTFRQISTGRGRQLSLEDLELLINNRLANVKSSFKAADPHGTGLVTKDEFRRLLQNLLPVSHNQLDPLLHQVCENSGTTVDYMQFLRRFSRAPTAHRACNRRSVRHSPQSTSMSLSEIQKHLQDKIRGNLRTIIRVFRLFDYSRGGHIQRHDFHRILDNYCIQLTDREFQRLWNHYSPNNSATISYEMFLEKLGFDDSTNFNIAPICTKLEVSSRGTPPTGKANPRKQRPESESSLCDPPSVLPHRKLQTLFDDKMCMNSGLVWQALQASDTTHSGLVQQDVLRAVLSNFIFPMNLQSFQKLTSRYGVRATGPVRWKHFLGHFMRPVNEDEPTLLHMDRTSEQPAPNKDDMNLQDIYPRLKEIFHLLDRKTDGSIARADLRHLLQRSGGTQPNSPQPRLSYSQITEVLNVLDPGHTGFVQLSTLERLDPNTASVSTGNHQPPDSPANTAEAGETKDTDAEEQKPPDEKHSTHWADKVSLASASRRTVENVLLDKLYEQLSSVLEALKMSDPQRTGYIKKGDLKKVLNRFGASISDAHLNKLCESSSRPGSSSTSVSYTEFLTNLGVSLTDEAQPVSPCCSDVKIHDAERPSPQLTMQSVRGLPAPPSPPVSPDVHSILDIVFKRMKVRLEQRNSSLTDRIQVITQSCDGTLTEADVRKILEDSWVILDDNSFNKFTELLGLIDGQIERSVFLAKYEAVAARVRPQNSEVQDDKDQVKVLLTSAEQCMAAMKTRIKNVFGDNLAAFRLMDKRRRGIVDCHDFKAVYSRLGFFCSEDEYQRLLDLIGLQPGGNLNFTEFVQAVENSGKRKQGTPAAFVQEQLHQLLAAEARHKWASVSKTLCKFDTDGQAWIHKGGLRGLLFTYALPISPHEFEQLWLRYDPEGRGCVPVCQFLEKLGFHHDGETRPQSQTINQQDSARPVSSDASSLEHIEQILQENYKGFSNALTHLGTRRDGTVTVKDLLNLLQTYNCSVQREQLVNHLRRFKVAMDDDCLRLSYMDFLSAFEHKVEKKHDPPPASPNALHPIESLERLSPARALERMKELVSASAPYLSKAFSAFDQSETGTVRALDFRKVLENFCARLSDKQYKHMLTKLELNGESCTVNWKDFLNNFQSQRQLISDKCMSRTSQRSPKTRSPDPQSRSCGTINVWNEISKTITDLDGTNSPTISKEQFRQLCDRHCLSLTNDQLECVWNQMPVNEQGQLQHKEFVKCFGALGRTPHTRAGSLTNSNLPPTSESRETGSATKPCCQNTTGALLQRTKSAPQSTPRRPPSLGRPGTGNPQASVERRLRVAVQRCWKEIQRSCNKKDPLQQGQISVVSFLEILHSLNIVLTREQLDHLAFKFDIMNNSQVSYKNFLHHFLLNLKPEENMKAFERRKLPRLSSQMSQGLLSADFMEVMLRMYEAVRSSWTAIRRSFLASDRNRTGSVSVQVFRKVLLHFSVDLSEEEFFHLTSYFDASTTGKICYNSFLWAFLH